MSSKKVFVLELEKSGKYQRLLGGEPQTCGMRSGRVCIQAGESVGRHSTKGCEEMLIFLSGQGQALIGEQEQQIEVGAGRISYIPPHTVHDIKNTGTEPLVYIYCVSPAKAE